MKEQIKYRVVYNCTTLLYYYISSGQEELITACYNMLRYQNRDLEMEYAMLLDTSYMAPLECLGSRCYAHPVSRRES